MFVKFYFIVQINGLSSKIYKSTVFYWQKNCYKFVYFDKLRNQSGKIKELSESDLQAKYNELSCGPQ